MSKRLLLAAAGTAAIAGAIWLGHSAEGERIERVAVPGPTVSVPVPGPTVTVPGPIATVVTPGPASVITRPGPTVTVEVPVGLPRCGAEDGSNGPKPCLWIPGEFDDSRGPAYWIGADDAVHYYGSI